MISDIKDFYFMIIENSVILLIFWFEDNVYGVKNIPHVFEFYLFLKKIYVQQEQCQTKLYQYIEKVMRRCFRFVHGIFGHM